MPNINFLSCECGTEVWLIYRAEITRGNVVVTRDIYRCLNCLTEHAGDEISLSPSARKSWRSHWAGKRISALLREGGPVHARKSVPGPGDTLRPFPGLSDIGKRREPSRALLREGEAVHEETPHGGLWVGGTSRPGRYVP